MVITLFVFVGFLQQTDMYLLDVLTNASCLPNIFICFLCFLSHPFRLSYLYLLWLWDVDHVNIRSLICMLHRSQALPLAAIMQIVEWMDHHIEYFRLFWSNIKTLHWYLNLKDSKKKYCVFCCCSLDSILWIEFFFFD